MATIGIRELRDNLTAVMRRVRNGETVEITHRGERVAVLAPAGPDRMARLAASGEVTVADRPFIAPRHRYPITGPMSGSQAIEEDRAER